jgi:hypothetical protein
MSVASPGESPCAGRCLVRGAVGWLVGLFCLCALLVLLERPFLVALPLINAGVVGVAPLILPHRPRAFGLPLLVAIDGSVFAYALAAWRFLGMFTFVPTGAALFCFGGASLVLWRVGIASDRVFSEFGQAAATGMVRRTAAAAMLAMFLGCGAASWHSMVAIRQTDTVLRKQVEAFVRQEVLAGAPVLTWSPPGGVPGGHLLVPRLVRVRAYVETADRNKHVVGDTRYSIVVEADRRRERRPPTRGGWEVAAIDIGIGKSRLPEATVAYTPAALAAMGLLRPEFAASLKVRAQQFASSTYLEAEGTYRGLRVQFTSTTSSAQIHLSGTYKPR